MRMIDKTGTWVQNTGEYRLPIYGRPGELLFLEPGEATKVDLCDFLSNQPTVEPVADPTSDEPAPAKKGK